jgi:hypothetical protein
VLLAARLPNPTANGSFGNSAAQRKGNTSDIIAFHFNLSRPSLSDCGFQPPPPQAK